MRWELDMPFWPGEDTLERQQHLDDARRIGRIVAMPDKTYKLIELVGISEESVQQAIRNAITRAARSMKGLDWFEVTEVRGLVKDGAVSQFQVKLKVGFRIFSEDEMRGSSTAS